MVTKTPEEELRDAVANGLPFNQMGDPDDRVVLQADLIRRLILGLVDAGGKSTALTPAGIEVHHARIEGRVALDKVIDAGGGPIVALEFHNCCLAGGFSGAHGKFSRLSFRSCDFAGHGVNAQGRPFPTIDLSDAEIHSGLDLEGVAPEGFSLETERPRGEGNYLWIKATGARIDGEINLSRAYLRAPPNPPELSGEDPPDALDVSLAQVAGDFRFRMGSRALGRIKGRNANFKGDVWLSGASLDGCGSQALLLQSARIAGLLVMDSRSDDVAGHGPYRWFHSRGQINLLQLRVGGKLILKNVNIEPSTEVRPSLAPSGVETETAPGPGMVGLTLEGAKVGASVEIVADPGVQSCLAGQLRFTDLEVKTEIILENVCLGLGPSEPADRSTIDAKSVSAESLTISGVRPLSDAGAKGWFAPLQHPLSVNLSDATIGKVWIENTRLTGRLNAETLRCSGDVHLHGRIGGEVDLAGAEIGGSLDIAGLRMDPTARYLSLKGGTIGHALRLARPSKPGARPPSLRRARRTPLTCLPDTALVETLWEIENDEWQTVFRQSAFLERRGTFYLLDRRADVLGDFVKRHGHRVEDTESAKEYFRIYCDYGPSELPCRWLVPAPDRLPPFAIAHIEQNAKKAHRNHAPQEEAPRHLAASAAGADALEALGNIDYILECDESATSQPARKFEIGAMLICGDLLARGRFHLFAGGSRQIHIQSCSGPSRGVRLTQLPIADGQYLKHPPAATSTDQWVTPSALETGPDLDLDDRSKLESRISPYLSSGFSMHNRIDLDNLTCTTLEDRAGRLWGNRARITMNHFTYRQAQWYPRASERKPSHQMLRDRFLATQAEWLWPLRKGPRADRLRERYDFWEPWQIRRNWIYQQFLEPPKPDSTEPRSVSICRYRIDEEDYRPQPFEQAIRVARAEGREDFAIHFEMLKQRIEWRLFNRLVRWWLGFLGIGLAALWLLINHGEETSFLFFSPRQWAVFGTLALTLALMIGASLIHTLIRKGFPWLHHLASRMLTWVVFFIPAAILFRATEWWHHPFHFLIALLIFLVVRCLSYLAYLVMRFGFGYLRRPVRAVGTLIVAFLVGWLGVNIANTRGMLVINAEPVAGLVRGHGRDGLMGLDNDASGTRFVHNVPCVPTISEPLYALDVLIPLVDLREESRCEVKRVGDADHQAPLNLDQAGFWELWGRMSHITLGNYRFWWLMKALYAIAGWFIVSLAILTFAQANRAHAEPPQEHK